MGMPQPMVPEKAFPSSINNEFEFLRHLEGSKKDIGTKLNTKKLNANWF
jgi:hypothetical protein